MHNGYSKTTHGLKLQAEMVQRLGKYAYWLFAMMRPVSNLVDVEQKLDSKSGFEHLKNTVKVTVSGLYVKLTVSSFHIPSLDMRVVGYFLDISFLFPKILSLSCAVDQVRWSAEQKK